MAFAAIAASVGFDTSANPGVINIPARTAGDLIMVVLEVDTGGAAPTLGALNSVSWSNIGTQAGSAASTGYFRIYYLIAGSSGSATTVTYSPAAFSTGFALDITGANSSTAPETAFVVSADPPSLDPAGWGTEDTLWIAACYRFTTAATANPSGYTAVNSNTWMRVGSKNSTASSEDPGAFTGGSGNATCVTIAVRPIGVVVPPKANLYRQMRRRRS